MSGRIWACKGDGEFEETTPLRLQEGNHRGATDFTKFQRGHGLSKIRVMGTRVLQNRVTNRVNFNEKQICKSSRFYSCYFVLLCFRLEQCNVFVRVNIVQEKRNLC